MLKLKKKTALPRRVQDPEQGATLDLTIEDMDDEPILVEDRCCWNAWHVKNSCTWHQDEQAQKSPQVW